MNPVILMCNGLYPSRPVHSSQVFVSYWIPCKVKKLREAIFNEFLPTILDLSVQRPKLLHQAIDNDGNTALGLAILLGRIKAVKILLKLGSDPNIANLSDGSHPLCFLAKAHPQGDPKTVPLAKLLLDAGSNPLCKVRCPLDPINRSNTNRTSSVSESPVSYCIRLQNEDLLKTYIAYQINMNICHSDTFTTPLMLAASLGYNQICKILLDAGAYINAINLDSNTPLHLAVQYPDVVETLIENGADANALNDDGYTPMMLLPRTKKT